MKPRKDAAEGVARALTHARAQGLLPAGARILVAASGGPDSTALLHALATRAPELGLGAVAAGHVDHGLRAGSADDAAYVRELSAHLGIEARVARVRVEGEGGVQAAARRARYAALETLRAELDADLVATAHTADDQAETVLLRLARGTAPGGLKGILPRRGRVVRPLLGCTRAVLGDYCVEAGLAPRDDPSNRSDAYLRVRVRGQVLPLMAETLNPDVARALARLADRARDEDRLLASFAREVASRAEAGGPGLDAAVLAEADPVLVRRVLADAWRRARGADAETTPVQGDHLDRLVERVRSGRGGELQLPGGVRAVLSCGRLGFSVGTPPALTPVRLDGPGRWTLAEGGWRVEVRTRPAQAADAPAEGMPDPLVRVIPAGLAPLTVRTRRPGDRLGSGGPLVADLLSRARIPRFARDRVPLVVAGPPEADGPVLWAVGVRGVPAGAVGERGRDGPALEVRFARWGP